MTDAPERILAIYNPDIAEDEMGATIVAWDDKQAAPSVEYIRADLVPQWQPIDTAPKSAVIILGFNEDYGIHKTWHSGTFKTWSRQTTSWEPTHWIPLPEPPKEGDAQ